MRRRIVFLAVAAAAVATAALLSILWIPRGKAAGPTADPPAAAFTASYSSGNAIQAEKWVLDFAVAALAGGKTQKDLRLCLLYESEFADKTLPLLRAGEKRIRDAILEDLKSWTPEDLSVFFPPQEKAIALVNRLNDFLRTEAVKTPVISIVVESALPR
jgi:hypothetical protein